jgi:LemA protein
VAGLVPVTHSVVMQIVPPVVVSWFAQTRENVTAPSKLRAIFRMFALVSVVALTASCGYNDVIDRDEDVKAAWSEVQNQYKRRADLVPNLVNVVKGSAKFEQETLQNVIEARASVGKVTIDASTIDDPAKLQAFEAAQSKLSGALGRLLAVSENYPDLKASAQFRDLQAQLEGTENRITVARNRYIGSVGEYNKTVLRFPTSIGASIRGKKERPNFSGNPADESPPEVKF